MERCFDLRATQRSRSGRPRWIPGMTLPTDTDHVSSRVQKPSFDLGPAASSPLPPPRAARTPRSRGIFLEPSQPPAPKRAPGRTRFSIIALAVAVVAITSALILGAPSAMQRAAMSHNPGPAIVGATSVAPAFVSPARTQQ